MLLLKKKKYAAVTIEKDRDGNIIQKTELKGWLKLDEPLFWGESWPVGCLTWHGLVGLITLTSRFSSLLTIKWFTLLKFHPFISKYKTHSLRLTVKFLKHWLHTRNSSFPTYTRLAFCFRSWYCPPWLESVCSGRGQKGHRHHHDWEVGGPTTFGDSGT